MFISKFILYTVLVLFSSCRVLVETEKELKDQAQEELGKKLTHSSGRSQPKQFKGNTLAAIDQLEDLFPSSLIIKRKDLWKFIFFTSHLEIGSLFVCAFNLHFTHLIALITDLTIVSFQIYDIVKTYGRVNVNHISINCCEQMTTCTEGALKKEAGDYENQ